MRTLRSRIATAASAASAAAALLLLPAARAAAQDTAAGQQPYRFTVHGYLAQYALDNGVGDRDGVGGYGVRVMFNRSDAARAARGLFGRASAGAYATFTTTQNGTSTQNIGGQLDVSLFPAPIARGLLDPFVSLGAGGFRTRVSGRPSGDDAETNLVITPAAGTRIPFFSGIGFRGDLRAPIVFGNDARVQFLAEGGIYVSF